MSNVSELCVVYRDEHFLAVDKPSGIPTTAPQGGPSLFALARQLDVRAPQLHPLSRLDTQVTGLVVFARTVVANEGVLIARREGRLARRYLGFVETKPMPASGAWHWSIGIEPKDPRKRRALAPEATGPGIKRAHTSYAVRAATSNVTALDLCPHTGRTHQLRVHAAAFGSPLLGDVAYGGIKRLILETGRILSAGRVMLHCAAVRLPHPDRGVQELQLSLDAAEDMQRLWTSAGGSVESLRAATKSLSQ